jgi:hypothetical protein
MSSVAVAGVLNVLRQLKTTEGLTLGHSGLIYLQNWAGDHSPSVVLRLSLGIIEQIEDARTAIWASNLSQEAKDGLLATLAGLSNAFGLVGMHNTLQSQIPALDPAITNFAIIASMVDAEITPDAKSEIDALVCDVDELCACIRASELDPVLRDAALRHLGALSALLRNAQAVGVGPAFTAYCELLWHLKGAQRTEESDEKREAAGFWATIAAWSDRLSNIANMCEAGAKVVPFIQKVPDLLKYLPG